MRMRKKKWVKPFLEKENEYLIYDFDILNNYPIIYLEIGMGMGDFICESANRNPDIFYLGLEKDETCVARAIKKAQELKLNNLRIALLNADTIDEYIKDELIDGIYLHFSDPWPKSGHHKRRLTYPTFLEKYKKILKKDGFIIFKSDNLDFFNDSLEYFKLANLKTIEIDNDYHKVLRDEPLTGYEKRFKDLGQKINYIKLSK